MKIKGEVILKTGKEQSVKRYHPWIFSGAIHSHSPALSEGSWACVMDNRKNILGYGHYHTGTIAVRVLSFGPEVPSVSFYEGKLRQCYAQRQVAGMVAPSTNAYRLVHGEGDGLSGLIVDIYNKVAVIQAHSAGMENDRHLVAEALNRVFQAERLTGIYFKSPTSHQGDIRSAYLAGEGKVPHLIRENGIEFYVDWESGQKTGFFLDQRDNRALLAHFAKDKAVLNTFCYTGGFSIYALKAGAKLVHSVDASEKAIAMTKTNIDLNGYDSAFHACYATDTFDFLKDKPGIYEVIVLDPPAFAKHQSARHQAMKGYQRLNAEAFRVVKSGGIIFTFSCSQVVGRQLFYDTVTSSAIQSGRTIKVLHHLSQPSDHPVSIYHPEGEYLKGLVLYVE